MAVQSYKKSFCEFCKELFPPSNISNPVQSKQRKDFEKPNHTVEKICDPIKDYETMCENLPIVNIDVDAEIEARLVRLKSFNKMVIFSETTHIEKRRNHSSS